MADAPGRPMKYPYTFTAKVAQFPYKFYYEKSWPFRYWLFGIVVAWPLFYKIGKLSYSPGNVAKWEETRKQMFTPHQEH